MSKSLLTALFIAIILHIFTPKLSGQVVNVYYYKPSDSLAFYSPKYWNYQSYIISNINYINNYRDIIVDTIFRKQLDESHLQLSSIPKSANYALLSNKIDSIIKILIKNHKAYLVRSADPNYYTEAICARSPKDAGNHFREGIKHYIDRNWDLAYQEFKNAISKDSTNPDFYRALFNIDILQHTCTQKTLDQLTKVLAMKPPIKNLQYYKFQILNELGLKQQAYDEICRLLDIYV